MNPVAVCRILPLPGDVTPVIVFVSQVSGSVSLDSTEMNPDPPCAILPVSATATGASFTQVTVIVPVEVLLVESAISLA